MQQRGPTISLRELDLLQEKIFLPMQKYWPMAEVVHLQMVSFENISIDNFDKNLTEYFGFLFIATKFKNILFNYTSFVTNDRIFTKPN